VDDPAFFGAEVRGGDKYRQLNGFKGILDWDANNTDHTNIVFLTGSGGSLARYSLNPGIYHCPADIYTRMEWGARMLRCRSLSMNGFIEGGTYGPEAGSTWFPAWRAYQKESGITVPRPSNLIVFVDEHPDSINDGWWITEVGANLTSNPGYWEDMPASYHNRACGFSFADGHSEMHKWRRNKSYVPVRQGDSICGTIDDPGSTDIMWTIQHVSAPLDSIGGIGL
jgi:prepilin-type processing-associated H-X9-DG protein